MQLDLFEHSRDVMLRNDLAQALLRADAAAALAALADWAVECPHDPALAAAAVLVEVLHAPSQAELETVVSATAALHHIERVVAAAAATVLGPAAAAGWLAGQWRALATRAAALPYRSSTELGAGHADFHAAAFWLRAGAWQEAAEAVQDIESWRRIPAPLAWMAQARWHLAGLDAGWPLLAELAWLGPQRFEPLVHQLPDPALHKLLRRFDAEFEGSGDSDDVAWFLAWALTDEPRLAGPLDAVDMSHDSEPARGAQLMLALLRLERQGCHAEVAAQRRRLKELNAELFRCCMKTR